MNPHDKILKKTNKYVYLKDGTHMSHSDWTKYVKGIKDDQQLITYELIKNSILKIIADKTILEDLQQEETELQYEVNQAQLQIQLNQAQFNQTNNWEEYYRNEIKKHDESKDKIVSHARNLYSKLKDLPIIKDFQNEKGIKFIIQENNIDEYRFCFDPYQLGSNFHSTLSDFYRGDMGRNIQNSFRTINGGWMKVIGNKVILYAQSGDYGVYNNEIAMEAASLIFPDKIITSYAGMSWEEYEAVDSIYYSPENGFLVLFPDEEPTTIVKIWGDK